MGTAFLLMAALLTGSNAQSAEAKIDFERLAQCIADVESGSKDDAIGQNGERGRYQIQKQLWQQISPLPFESAHDPLIAKRVAIRHLEWLEKKLASFESLDRSRVYLIALGWNAGPQAVIHVFATRNQRDYAQRVENLYLSNHDSNPRPQS